MDERTLRPAAVAATPAAPDRRPAPRATARPTPVCISSDTLFAGANEVHIEHRGARYRLQQTSLGKLILTK